MTEEEVIQKEYALEKYYAAKILEAAPFSDEREKITNEAYAAIAPLVRERGTLRADSYAYGARDQYADMIRALLLYLNRKNPVFYEAGVGTGDIIRSISETTDAVCRGCDVNVLEELRTIRAEITECSLWRALAALPDDSIDLFYWNDVMEHIAPDEVERIMALIAAKLKTGGIVFTITPNRKSGPHDITRDADPEKKEAKGLHLREYTFQEVNALYRKNGLTPGPALIGVHGNNYVIGRGAPAFIKLQSWLEKHIGRYAPSFSLAQKGRKQTICKPK